MTVTPPRERARRRTLRTRAVAVARRARRRAPAAARARRPPARPAPTPDPEPADPGGHHRLHALAGRQRHRPSGRAAHGLGHAAERDRRRRSPPSRSRCPSAPRRCATAPRSPRWLGGDTDGVAHRRMSRPAPSTRCRPAATQVAGIGVEADNPALQNLAPGVYPLVATYRGADGPVTSTSAMIVPDDDARRGRHRRRRADHRGRARRRDSSPRDAAHRAHRARRDR